MPIHEQKYHEVTAELKDKDVQLIAVSKLQPVDDIKAIYNLGQRDFGENYVQELTEKYELLPKDIKWHFIGHLQRNKVKYIAPFVHLIHGIDSIDLLKEINKQGRKNNRIISCLLQVHIAQEETKFGMNEEELDAAMNEVCSKPEGFSNIKVDGLMGMASFSDDMDKVRGEMKYLKTLFDKQVEIANSKSQITNERVQLSTLSMGMSGDYRIAIEEGSTMVRIGSLLFGERKK